MEVRSKFSHLWAQLILCLVSVCFFSLFVHSSLLHPYQGKMAFYDKGRKFTLHEAHKFCSEFGGHLPSVHSSEDFDQLFAMMGNDTERYMWLGAVPKYQNTSFGVYEWADGTPFDFNLWHGSHPSCNSSCCGVATNNFGTRTGSKVLKFFDTYCDADRSAVCVTSLLTNQSSQVWLTLSENRVKLEQLEREMKRTAAENALVLELLSRQVNQSIDQNNSDTASLNDRINIGLIILLVIVMVQAITLMVKLRIIHRLGVALHS